MAEGRRRFGLAHVATVQRLAGNQAVAQLLARSTLRLGLRGPDVEALQRDLGFDSADVDGVFGPKTDKAVRAFQQSHFLALHCFPWVRLGAKSESSVVAAPTRARYGSITFSGPR